MKQPICQIDHKKTTHYGPWNSINLYEERVSEAQDNVQNNREKTASQASIEIISKLYSVGADGTAEDLELICLPLFQQYIEFDSAWMAISVITPGGPIFSSHNLLGLPPDYVQAWLEVKALDTITPKLIRSPNTATVISRMETTKSSRFDCFLTAYNIAQAMCIMYVDLTNKICTNIGLYREHFLPRFSERDRRIVEQVSTGLMRGISEKHSKPRNPADAGHAITLESLTPKELQVSELFAKGLTYKAVARQLDLSPFTVRHHLRSTYAKLGISDKGEMAWIFSKLGV